MRRRSVLALLAAGGALAGRHALAAGPATGAPGADAPARLAATGESDAPAPTRLAAAWRGLAEDSPQHVGLIGIDWAARSVTVLAEQAVPSRAHGLLAERDGGWLAVAFRPGGWLWRLDAAGRVVRRVSIDDEPGGRRFGGHVIAHPDGRTLYTNEFDVRTGEGLVGVRDADTLRKLGEWPSGGLDPHQLTFDPRGRLVVANGGLPRTADGRKRDLDRMDSSIAAFDPATGAMLGQWRLRDRRLGLRHVAWTAPEDGPPLLGIALQAEHDDPGRRSQAPVLAVWDGDSLDVPSRAADGQGYAGDIAPAAGGFVVTCQHARVAMWWHRDRPGAMPVVARMQEACAVSPVAAFDGGVVVAGALGLGRWHPARPGAMLRWPRPMALDNHWVEVVRG